MSIREGQVCGGLPKVVLLFSYEFFFSVNLVVYLFFNEVWCGLF